MVFFVFKRYFISKLPGHYINRKIQASTARTAVDLEEQPALNIDIAKPTKEEIKKAINAMSKNKTPGIDEIQADLLQADADLSADALLKLFSKIRGLQIAPPTFIKM